MTDAPPSEKHVDALLQFYQEAQVDSAKAKRGEETAETPQLYSLQALVPAAKLKEGEKSYERLLNTFGESLDLKVGVKDNDENWTILYVDAHRGTVERADFAHLPEHPADLNLEISIDKCALIQKLKLDQTRYNCFFYLFEENLVTFLSAPLLNLDGLLFSETCPQAGEQNKTSENDKPVLILLSETDVHFAGEMLTIVSEPRLAADSELMATLQGQQPAKTGPAGASVTADQENPTLGDYVRSALNFLSGKQAATPPQAPSPSAPLSGTLQEQIQKYRATARETPSLIGGQFEHLTPLHFLGQWRIKHSALEKILAIHFVNICILYTASRSTIDADRNPVESVYNSADRTAILNLKEAPESAISTATLESLARWLYSGKGTDQRTVFQNIIARELYGDDATATYNNFIARIPRLWKDTVWQYQVFVDGRITKHFEEWQKMRGYVAEVNKKISEAIDSITKGLTDTLLATIGVLVLTVLAALVKKDTSIEIFKISMGVYSIYLLFYAVYRMGSTGHSYRLLSNEAGVQLSEYRAALGLEEITDISLPLKRRRRQFHIWFWLTVVLYLVLGGSIWWAGKKGPQLLIDRGIITAPGAKAAEASSSVFGMQPIPSTNSESNSNSDASGDRIVRKMGVDYQKLSERYANFLVAVGGVSITVLAVVLSLGESDSSGSKSASRAFLVAALLAATVARSNGFLFHRCSYDGRNISGH